MRKLVNGEQLLKELFDPPPCMDWLDRRRADRTIPFLRVGRKIFYDADEVRQALDRKQTVRARVT